MNDYLNIVSVVFVVVVVVVVRPSVRRLDHRASVVVVHRLDL